MSSILVVLSSIYLSFLLNICIKEVADWKAILQVIYSQNMDPICQNAIIILDKNCLFLVYS